MLTIIKKGLMLLCVVPVALFSAATFEGTTWIFTKDIMQFSRIPMVFENGKVLAMFRCFTTHGDYTVSGTSEGGLQIQIQESDQTCSDDSQNVNYNEEYTSFLASLEKVMSFKISTEGALNLTTSDNDTLQFQKSEASLPFSDKVTGKWSSVNTSSYFYFWGNGDFELYDGCNQNWGFYQIVNDSLKLDHKGGTLKACMGPEVHMEFPGTGRFALHNDTLTITNSSATYYYTRPTTGNRNIPNRKMHYSLNAFQLGDDMLFDCNGRALKSQKADCRGSAGAGIYFRRHGEGGRASIHILTR